MVSDSDANEVHKYVIEMKYAIDIYVEHKVKGDDVDDKVIDNYTVKMEEPKYLRFQMEEFDKNYKFKEGLKFVSLDEFSEAITERSVLNDREIKYVNNDKVGVMAVCKGKCGFLALVSKVRNKHMYRLKRWVGTHTYGRVLNNSSKNSKWIVKIVAAMMTYFYGVKIRDIVYEIRSSYYVDITVNKAWKETN